MQKLSHVLRKITDLSIYLKVPMVAHKNAGNCKEITTSAGHACIVRPWLLPCNPLPWLCRDKANSRRPSDTTQCATQLRPAMHCPSTAGRTKRRASSESTLATFTNRTGSMTFMSSQGVLRQPTAALAGTCVLAQSRAEGYRCGIGASTVDSLRREPSATLA